MDCQNVYLTVHTELFLVCLVTVYSYIKLKQNYDDIFEVQFGITLSEHGVVELKLDSHQGEWNLSDMPTSDCGT